jgi:hypothetical protein
MSARITRTARRARLLSLSAVALAATLSLTACESGEGTKDAGAATNSARPSDNASPAPSDDKPAESGSNGTSTGKTSQGTQGSPASTGSSQGTQHAKKTPSGSDPNAPKNRAVCNSKNIKITAQVLKRPLDTMLLTATNTGSKLCDFGGAPIVRFENAQSVPPAMEDTKGQAVTSIQPGESAYAAIKLTQNDNDQDPGYWAKTLAIGFYDMKQKPLDGFTNVPLKGKDGVYIDSSVRVSYWQNDLDSVSNL